MHNCKETKERLIELALDQAVLPAELSKCDECRAEFEALNATLRATTRLRETVAPPEDYWIGYHVLLREKLSRAKTQRRKERRKGRNGRVHRGVRESAGVINSPLVRNPTWSRIAVSLLPLCAFAPLRSPAPRVERLSPRKFPGPVRILFV